VSMTSQCDSCGAETCEGCTAVPFMSIETDDGLHLIIPPWNKKKPPEEVKSKWDVPIYI